jgi:hypothetical protein
VYQHINFQDFKYTAKFVVPAFWSLLSQATANSEAVKYQLLLEDTIRFPIQ